MRGTIYVDKFMEYAERQRRMLEWLYLKEYWKASEEDKPEVLALYGQPLVRALEKYNRRFEKGIDKNKQTNV